MSGTPTGHSDVDPVLLVLLLGMGWSSRLQGIDQLIRPSLTNYTPQVKNTLENYTKKIKKKKKKKPKKQKTYFSPFTCYYI